MPYTLKWEDRQSRQKTPAQATVDPEFCNGGFRVFGEGVENLKLSVTANQFTKIFSAAIAGAELLFPDDYADIMLLLMSAADCLVQDGACVTYLPSASFVEFEPQNPYTEPDTTPPDYEVPPFFVNDELEYSEDFGYLQTDVFVAPAAINIDPIDLVTFNLPTIKITVVGSGEIELNLLAVTLGSYVVIKVGSPPNIFDIIVDGITEGVKVIDLNLDVVSVPPETDIVYTEEIVIEAEAETETEVYIVFVPAVDDSIIPLRYGGGIRSIELCGFGEVAVIDCEQVEDCLETSPTIIEIETNITEIENNITIINEQIIELGDTINIIDDDGNGNSGVVPPDYRNSPSAGGNYDSAACQAAHFMADKVIEVMAEFWEDAGTLTPQELALQIIGIGGFRMEAFASILAFVVSGLYPTLPEDALDYRDNLAEAFFCNNLLREEAASAILADTGVPSDIRNAMSLFTNFIQQDKLNAWAYSTDFEIYEYDCSEMCEYDVWFIFDGSNPVDLNEEEDTVYRGNHWQVYNGEFVDGTGYVGLLEVWGITLQMPKDCRIAQMQVGHAKNVPCASVKERVTWRGTTGDDPEDFTSDATILSNTIVIGDWDLHSAEIADMAIEHDHFLCDSQWGSKIAWVRFQGTGGAPRP